MNHSLVNLKLNQEVAFETTSLNSEGYFTICTHNWSSLVYVKLQHKCNGNQIDIFGYPSTMKIVIKKNGKIIKERTIS